MRKFLLALFLCTALVACGTTESGSSDTVETTTITSTTTTGTSTTTTSTTTTTKVTSTTTTTTTTTTAETTTEPVTTVTEVVTEPVVYVEPVEEPVYIPIQEYSDSDVVLLAKLISLEASANYDGKLAVGSCVVNRMNILGCSMYDVIYAPYQFSVAGKVAYANYSQSDYEAASQILSSGATDTRIYYFDANGYGLNNFYDRSRNFLYAT